MTSFNFFFHEEDSCDEGFITSACFQSTRLLPQTTAHFEVSSEFTALRF